MLDGQMFEAMCTDIGPGGAYLATAVMAAAGTRISVALASPNATSMIAVPAEVMYVVHRSTTRQTGIAVRWMETSPSLRRVISAIESAVEYDRGRPLAAAQAITSPMPAAVASDAAIDRTAKYSASPPSHGDMPITQRTRKKM
jgi:Tfp pilus assembly protein PilZ